MRRRTLGYSSSFAVVIGHVNGVAQERLVHRTLGPIEQHEMELVDVERVQLGGTVFDDPVFHVALLHDDIRHIRSGIERLGSLAIHRDDRKSWRC